MQGIAQSTNPHADEVRRHLSHALDRNVVLERDIAKSDMQTGTPDNDPDLKGKGPSITNKISSR
jgi:hypothetical protein